MDPHQLNIAAHVTLGLAALVLGPMVLARPKGDRPHKAWGRSFVWLVAGVVVTAAVGFMVFRRDAGLGAVTVLVAYQLFSGVRVARGRGRPPSGFDTFLAASAFVAGVAFLAYLFTGAPNHWKPQVTGPIGGALLAMSGYDLWRLSAPNWRARIWPLEHGVKMISVMGALASAGLGTIAPQFAPYSQVGPSAFFSLYALVYILWRGGAQIARLAPAE